MNAHESFIPLDSETIIKETGLSPTDLTLFKTVDSTNEYLKTCTHPLANPHYCLSEQQTRGKGQLGRSWHSPFGENIYFSMCYPFKKDRQALSSLSLIIGVMLAKTIETVYTLPEPIQLKWPNDLLCQNKKLAGILIEIEAETHGYYPTIIGIGINVNMMPDDRHAIDQAWTSIRQRNGKYNDRNTLCIALIRQLQATIPYFETKGLAPFLKDWSLKDALLGSNIQIKKQDHLITATVLGINDQGHLRVTLPDGQETTMVSL